MKCILILNLMLYWLITIVTGKCISTPEGTKCTPDTTIYNPLNGPPGGLFDKREQQPMKATPHHEQLYKQCLDIRNRDMRSACIRISKNPILKNMGNGTKGVIDDRELTFPFIIGRGLHFQFISEHVVQNVCDQKMNCPDGEELKRTDDNMSSLSPWKYCMQYDSLRYPQWINVAQCLCSGCLHPFTGAEIHGNVLSKEIHVEINVLRKFSLKHPFSKCNRKICEETTQKIPIGCHCQIANVQNV